MNAAALDNLIAASCRDIRSRLASSQGWRQPIFAEGGTLVDLLSPSRSN